MTDKEKAKAYDNAIERAKNLYDNGIIEEIFPELKEDDTERIRKNCIYFLKLQKRYYASTFEIEECIDWLEKQGKNSTNKNKPKFNVGDWIIFIKSKSVYQVEKIENYEYTLRHILGGSLHLPFSNEKLIREWTIQDSKDGDVIHMGIVTAIFKKYIGKEECICYCSFCKDGGFEIPIENREDNVYGCYNVTPATKEQRDALMKAMNDAGYKWDVEKKILYEK